MDLRPGLYECLLTAALAERLERLPRGLQADLGPLASAEAPDRVALHVGSVLRRMLADVDEAERVDTAVRLARQLVREIAGALHGAQAELAAGPELLLEPGTLLAAILPLRPDGTPAQVSLPLTPLLDTTLLTNAPDEPRIGRQIEVEIASADSIDVVMAFIRRSGLRPLLAALRRHTEAGRRLRFLTTTYTGSTEAQALDQLAALGATVKVSYNTTTTRLHAKAWLLHRESGFSTAFIGSSNLTHSAQVSGLEWNVRASAARNPDVVAKMAAVFESYWQSGEFQPYDREQFLELTLAAAPTPTRLSPIELRPEPFQERLLEQLSLARSQGHHRNLLVSATGTGKTVMAAVDYARLRPTLARARLLFVAHRKEILEKSLSTFRHALRDGGFGELWVDGRRPEHFEHVFASIQSLQHIDLDLLDAAHFDVVIVDEFHHAAADSYGRLLDHLRPRELLGLTATPERSDGLSILHHFDGRTAAELRLWDAIDQHHLTPFLYFGIHDQTDLSHVPWKRGRGYDIDALSRVLTGDEHRARLVLGELEEHVDDLGRARVLGFCVSVEHARFMARVFEQAGVAAIAIWGDSPREERELALRDLDAGRIQVLFSVDLFNEGVDLPNVDTLLLLRPTDSATLFLQQLGRGLRKAHGKSACTVLDFVGQHRREFRMDRRYRALLGGSRSDLLRQVEAGFPVLPAGCHMQLDAVASRLVLDNIRAAVPSQWKAKATELAALAAESASGDLSLATFLESSGLELTDVYRSAQTWSDLRSTAGLPVAPAGPHEHALRRACGRLLHVDDPERLDTWRRWLAAPSPATAASLTEPQRRLLRMLIASLANKVVDKDADVDSGAELVWRHPQVRAELLELFDVLATRITHTTPPLASPSETPLRVHARYTRIEILAAAGIDPTSARVAPWQSGVYWAAPARSDLVAFTLDKSGAGFSPTTRYRDYAISRELIHWESQSTTAADSQTGLRYQHHAREGSHILLFARHRPTELAFHFLGSATYVEHRSERPMAITWRLDHPLPGNLFASFAAAVA